MLSGFIGRHAQLRELKERIDGGAARLVTLTGVGGTGKTRLAAEFAGEHDDVVFVELASVDAESVLTRVGEALLIRDQSARDQLDVVIDHLQRRDLLLVLDNCEHVREAAASFTAAVLRRVPGLRILATSREALGLPGEHVVVVPPLELPPFDVPMSAAYEAVALLADRAAASVPGWELTEANWPAVVRLLDQVGGLPLAIELATVRLRAMSLDEVVKRLKDQVRLLTRNDRVALPHHRTLRAVLDWSHDLCTPAEQQLWARASVFAGDWNLAAAEAVCGGDVTDDLAGLVAKSIVLFDGGRYRLLEPLRQYGAEKLEAMGEKEAVLLRHRDHYTGLVHHVSDTWYTAPEGSAATIPAIQTEMANIRVALATSLAEPERAVVLCLNLGRSMAPYFFGGMPELRRWTARALDLSQDCPPSTFRADALTTAGHIALCQGDHDEFERRYAEAVEVERKLGTPQAAVSFMRGAHLWKLRGDRAALGPLRDARDGFARRGPTQMGQEVVLTVQLALATAMLGDEQEIRAVLREMEGFADSTGAALSVAESAWARAVMELRFGDPRTAEDLLTSALVPQRDSGDQWGAVWTTVALTWVTAATGQARRTARLLGASTAMQRLTGLMLDLMKPFAELRDQAVARARAGCAEYDEIYARHAGLPSLAEVFAAVLDDGPGEVLTPAQLEVAALVAAGRTNREIAGRLHKSVRTVETQVQQIFTALGVNRRVLIARWYEAR